MVFGRNCNSCSFSTPSQLPIVRFVRSATLMLKGSVRPVDDRWVKRIFLQFMESVFRSFGFRYVVVTLRVGCVAPSTVRFCVVYEYRVNLTWFSPDVHRRGSKRRCARLTTWLRGHNILRAVTRACRFISRQLSPFFLWSREWERPSPERHIILRVLDRVIVIDHLAIIQRRSLRLVVILPPLSATKTYWPIDTRPGFVLGPRSNAPRFNNNIYKKILI